MSKDGMQRVGLMSTVPLPDASRRNVLLALQAVRTAPKASKITDRWLKSEHSIGQDKQATRVLRFLQFIDSRKKLTENVLSKRQNWEQFRQLILEQVRRGCMEIGIDQGNAGKFGAGSWDDFEDQLRRSGPVSSRSERSQDSIVACFRALVDVCEMDEESFSADIESLSPSKSGERETVGRKDSKADVLDNEISCPIVRHADGQIVYARLTFSEPMQPGDLRRLAEILRTMDISPD